MGCLHDWKYDSNKYQDVIIIRRICNDCKRDERMIANENEFQEYDGR